MPINIDKFLAIDPAERRFIVFVKDEDYDLLSKVASGVSNEEKEAITKKLAGSVGYDLAVSLVARIALIMIGGVIVPTLVLVPVAFYLRKLWKSNKKASIVRIVPISLNKGLKLPPGHPSTNGVTYAVHPTQSNIYVPLGIYHQFMFEHKQSELLRLLGSLGAQQIAISYVTGYNKELSVNGGGQYKESKINADFGRQITKGNQIIYYIKLEKNNSFEMPKDLVWFPYENKWGEIAELRLKRGLMQYSLELNYKDDYGVNACLEADIKKMHLSLGGHFHKFKETTWRIDLLFTPRD